MQVVSRLQQQGAGQMGGGGSSLSLEGFVRSSNASAAVGASAGADARGSGAAGGGEDGSGEERGGGGGGDTGEDDGLDAEEQMAQGDGDLSNGSIDEAVSGIAGPFRGPRRARGGALTRAVAGSQGEETEWGFGSDMDDGLREALRVPPADAAGHCECCRAGPGAGSRPQRSVARVTACDGARNGL